MTEPPAPRPDSEKTRVLYLSTTSQIMSVFADILDAVTDRLGSSYARVMEPMGH